MLNEYYKHFGSWQDVVQADLLSKTNVTKHCFYNKRGKIVSAIAESDHNDRHGLTLKGFESVALKSVDIVGDVSVEFTLRWPRSENNLDGVEVMINAVPDSVPQAWYPLKGYSCQFACNLGVSNYISRNTGAAPNAISMAEGSYAYDTDYRCKFEREGK